MEHSSCSSPADKQCGDALRFWGFGYRIMMRPLVPSGRRRRRRSDVARRVRRGYGRMTRPMGSAFDETSDMSSGFNKPFSIDMNA